MLRTAGLDPEVIVSGVPEDDVDEPDVERLALLLAERKANAVAALTNAADAIVVGCDSLFELEGVVAGKPADAREATERWRAMRGRSGTLVTGHWVVDNRAGASAGDVAATTVRFGHPTDDEIDAYVATGEPMLVAGGFTLDGRSAPFIRGVDGDPSNVIGLSLPLLRDLLGRIATDLVDLWRPSTDRVMG